MLFLRRINILNIVEMHLDTFYNDKNQKTCWLEILFVFLVIPLGLAYFISHHPILFTDKFYEIVIQLFAIIGGFLINSIILMADKKSSYKPKNTSVKDYLLIKETYYNASFGIILAFLAVFTCSIYFLISEKEMKVVITWIVISLLWLFIHTMFMVLKRLLSIF